MRVLRAGLLALFCAGGIGAQPPAPLSESDRTFIEIHFAAAKQAEAAQEFGKAAEEYQTILGKFPRAVPRVHHNLGLALYFDRKCEAAIASLRKASQLEAGVAATHLLTGMSYMCLQDARKALPEFQLAHKLEPTTETAVQLGMAYSVLNQPRSAVKFFRAGLESGDDETVLYLLGEEYMRLAKGVAEGLIARYADTAYDNLVIARIFDSQQFHHVAAQAYLKAIKKDPWNAACLLRLAYLLAILGRKPASDLTLERYRLLSPADESRQLEAVPTRAIDVKAGGNTDFEQEIRALPPVDATMLPAAPLLPTSVNDLLRKRAANPSGKWHVVIAYFRGAQYKEAITALEGFASESTDWLPAYLSAYAYLWSDDLDRAEHMVNRPALTAETGPAVQMLRWEIFEQLGRAYYQKLLDQYPASARAHFVRARILDAEEKPEAVAEYKAAIAANPKQPGIRLALADNLMLNARIPEALDLCRQELDIDPPSVDARAYIGRIYVDMRQPDQALPYLQAALKSRADDATLHSALGRLYELRNQMEPAAAEYRRALALDPSQNKLHYLLANVYRRLGRNALADKESELFQRKGMAEREQHIHFIQRYYRSDKPSRPAERGTGRQP